MNAHVVDLVLGNLVGVELRGLAQGCLHAAVSRHGPAQQGRVQAIPERSPAVELALQASGSPALDMCPFVAYASSQAVLQDPQDCQRLMAFGEQVWGSRGGRSTSRHSRFRAKLRMSASVRAAEGAAKTARAPTRTSRRVEAMVLQQDTIQSAGTAVEPASRLALVSTVAAA